VKLLLDTHIWLWALGNPGKLSKRVTAELNDPTNEVWLSPVSVWEALMLHAKKRIHLSDDLNNWFSRATQHTREAPLTHEIAFLAHHLNLRQKDPADRFLAATAKTLRLVLVTQDPELVGLGDIQTLANRPA
jgi:PIN domain nuclease of toxin-antitoxin system